MNRMGECSTCPDYFSPTSHHHRYFLHFYAHCLEQPISYFSSCFLHNSYACLLAFLSKVNTSVSLDQNRSSKGTLFLIYIPACLVFIIFIPSSSSYDLPKTSEYSFIKSPRIYNRKKMGLYKHQLKIVI